MNTCTCKDVSSLPPESTDWSEGSGNDVLDLLATPGGESVGSVSEGDPEDTAGGFAGCLAGEATGWTLKRLARCCAGYSFHALTAPEVYETYGVAPYASDVLAAAVTIGVCLKIT